LFVERGEPIGCSSGNVACRDIKRPELEKILWEITMGGENMSPGYGALVPVSAAEVVVVVR